MWSGIAYSKPRGRDRVVVRIIVATRESTRPPNDRDKIIFTRLCNRATQFSCAVSEFKEFSNAKSFERYVDGRREGNLRGRSVLLVQQPNRDRATRFVTVGRSRRLGLNAMFDQVGD